MKSVAESYRVGYATVRLIVKEVCEAIWSEVGPDVMAFPTVTGWRQLAQDFGRRWQFPNCVGSVDGKHVMIKKPAHSGSINFNYKGFCSIVLMAVVDAMYRFTFISVGGNGQESDGGVWSACDLGRMLEAQLQGGPQVFPGPEPLPGTDAALPHVLVGDEAFPLRPFMMRPFPGTALTSPQRRVANYRMSRARLTCENAFGILAQRWRVYGGAIGCTVPTAKLIVQATCVLHNFLRSKDIARNDLSPGCYSCVTADERGDVAGLVDIHSGESRNFTREAARVREKFTDYFSGVGRVPWQDGR